MSPNQQYQSTVKDSVTEWGQHVGTNATQCWVKTGHKHSDGCVGFSILWFQTINSLEAVSVLHLSCYNIKKSLPALTPILNVWKPVKVWTASSFALYGLYKANELAVQFISVQFTMCTKQVQPSSFRSLFTHLCTVFLLVGETQRGTSVEVVQLVANLWPVSCILHR